MASDRFPERFVPNQRFVVWKCVDDHERPQRLSVEVLTAEHDGWIDIAYGRIVLRVPTDDLGSFQELTTNSRRSNRLRLQFVPWPKRPTDVCLRCASVYMEKRPSTANLTPILSR